MVALFDNEEVGSKSAQGAGSTVMLNVVTRVTNTFGTKPNLVEKAAQRSYLVSADMAHALHPNYMITFFGGSGDGVMDKATTTRFKVIEITVEGLKVESVAVHRDLQRILTMLEKKGEQTDSSSNGTSVNDNKDRVNGRTGGSETGERSGDQKPWRKRIGLPTSDGEEPLSWLNRAERFFDIQKVEDDDEKVEIAYVSMEGLKEAMINRFCVGARGTVFERLATIRQERTAEEFVRKFEILTGQTRGIPEDQVLGYFLDGLREEVKGQVRIQIPAKLMDAMRIARDVEDAMMISLGSHFGGLKINPFDTRSTGSVVRSEPSKPTMMTNGRNETGGPTRREGGGANTMTRASSAYGGDSRARTVRNLPYPEYLKRREEGRCFRCGGPFAPGHRCAERSLRVLLLVEDEDEEESEMSEEPGEKLMELSACSAEGWTNPGTLKTRGTIGDQKVVVLIDGGASHNYISKNVTEELGLTVTNTTPYSVSLGDRCKRITQGRCEKVRIRLDEVELEEEFHVFELGGVDVILGVAWLAKLGVVKTDWADMVMEYDVGKKRIWIKGDPAL
ncbi:hypothetical protein V8G54_008459 [Vigna mungo]|uniref:Retrotransposon gag domain-containing protein n=1 Tax=Vigna mungo TaxID=3915 RepID=A0AAQ3S892_VIGMU